MKNIITHYKGKIGLPMRTKNTRTLDKYFPIDRLVFSSIKTYNNPFGAFYTICEANSNEAKRLFLFESFKRKHYVALPETYSSKEGLLGRGFIRSVIELKREHIYTPESYPFEIETPNSLFRFISPKIEYVENRWKSKLLDSY